jgi:hypothetical protein
MYIMGSRLFVGVAMAGVALFLSSLPGFAIETVTLPQTNPDGSSSYQDPDAQAQSKFSTDQDGNMKVDGLGAFHFSVSQGSGFAGDPNSPGYYYRPGTSSQAGYGAANTPGSEFYNSGYPFPH